MRQNDITVMRRDRTILPYQDLVFVEDQESKELAFEVMIGRIKKQYRQLAEYLGVVCRVDVQVPQTEFGLIKVEKTINALLREIMSRESMIVVSVVSYEENDRYSIQVNCHFQEKPGHKHEGISPSIIGKAKKLGVTVVTNARTNSKLSYDFYSH
ncbi:MAG: hypothetical protein ACI9CE_002186 [Flavobacterium sp.]|jgi:hypothetical protein